MREDIMDKLNEADCKIETKEERIRRMSRERASKWRANNKERHVEYTHQWRLDNKDKARKHSMDYYIKNKDKHVVHTYVSKAMVSGKLVKPPKCEGCLTATNELHGHHNNYKNRLDVNWLCRSCHAETHRLGKVIYGRI
jgi:hypothetical protein